MTEREDVGTLVEFAILVNEATRIKSVRLREEFRAAVDCANKRKDLGPFGDLISTFQSIKHEKVLE